MQGGKLRGAELGGGSVGFDDAGGAAMWLGDTRVLDLVTGFSGLPQRKVGVRKTCQNA